ncbi:MAG: hypothetical protein VX178_04915 [Pseudomonadota bacterium]|nr:hypothetical protein [Pseudomonadota bacterium]
MVFETPREKVQISTLARLLAILNCAPQPLRIELGPHGSEHFEIHQLFVEHTGLLTECPVLEGRRDDLPGTAIPPILQMFLVGSEHLLVQPC